MVPFWAKAWQLRLMWQLDQGAELGLGPHFF